MKKVRSPANLIIATVSLGLALIVTEVFLRLFVESTTNSFGIIFGLPLPPERIVQVGHVPPRHTIKASRDTWHGRIVVDGRKITVSDLWGISRADMLLGFAPEENAISTNGWWQTNELGARSHRPISKKPAAGQYRTLFFGESFIQGSRVPQHETPTHYINQAFANIEAVNFGVDGYGMGQAFLRFRTVKGKLDFHHVVLVFAPTIDLWRDISVNRHMADGWAIHTIQPRFKVIGGKLELIPSPYWKLENLVADSREGDTDLLKEHHRRYDAFYFSARYSSIPLFDWSVVFRLTRRAIHVHQRQTLISNLMEPDSEAIEVSRMIFDAMAREVRETGAEFSLAILPVGGDTRDFADSREFRFRWNTMIKAVCVQDFHCLDLMPKFQAMGHSALDKGYDGHHYGPRTNRFIAGLLGEHLASVSP